MSYVLKSMANKLMEICDAIDPMPFSPCHKNPKLKLRKLFLVNVSSFMMYLSASDGQVSWNEVSFLNNIFDANFSAEDVCQFIRDNNIYSTKFESEAPLILDLFVEMDNFLIAQGRSDGTYVSHILIDFYEKIGQHLSNSDGEIAANERTDLNIYLDMMRRYVRGKLNISGQKYSVPGKNTGSQNSLKSKYQFIKKN